MFKYVLMLSILLNSLVTVAATTERPKKSGLSLCQMALRADFDSPITLPVIRVGQFLRSSKIPPTIEMAIKVLDLKTQDNQHILGLYPIEEANLFFAGRGKKGLIAESKLVFLSLNDLEYRIFSGDSPNKGSIDVTFEEHVTERDPLGAMRVVDADLLKIGTILKINERYFAVVQTLPALNSGKQSNLPETRYYLAEFNGVPELGSKMENSELHQVFYDGECIHFDEKSEKGSRAAVVGMADLDLRLRTTECGVPMITYGAFIKWFGQNPSIRAVRATYSAFVLGGKPPQP